MFYMSENAWFAARNIGSRAGGSGVYGVGQSRCEKPPEQSNNWEVIEESPISEFTEDKAVSYLPLYGVLCDLCRPKCNVAWIAIIDCCQQRGCQSLWGIAMAG